VELVLEGEGSIDSRFVRKVCEVSSHQVATGTLQLVQMVELSRMVGRAWPHSLQSIMMVWVVV
jgi:hypothetical protein